MKPIKPTELKEGDWIRTEDLYDFMDKKGSISLRYSIAKVKKIEVKNVKKEGVYIEEKTIYIDSYAIKRDEISKGVLDTNQKLYLLNKKERGEIMKRLILMNLE